MPSLPAVNMSKRLKAEALLVSKGRARADVQREADRMLYSTLYVMGYEWDGETWKTRERRDEP